MNSIIQNFNRTGVTNPFRYSLYIGFFAGLFWSLMRMIFYYCNFTAEPAAFLIKWWLRDDQLTTAWGQILGAVSFIVFSILAALLYMLLFRTLEGPWPGLWYGIGWWGILFGLGPILHFTSFRNGGGFGPAATDLCLFLVWGLFIGYSIAFEFTDESTREPTAAT